MMVQYCIIKKNIYTFRKIQMKLTKKGEKTPSKQLNIIVLTIHPKNTIMNILLHN